MEENVFLPFGKNALSTLAFSFDAQRLRRGIGAVRFSARSFGCALFCFPEKCAAYIMMKERHGEMVYAVVSWIVLSIVVGAVANSIDRSFGAYFCLSLFLSPLIGFVVLAIKGKMTAEERQTLEDKKYATESHIYFCNNCGKTYSGFGLAEKNEDYCNQCKQKLIETDFLTGEWRSYSLEERMTKKEEIKRGQHVRRHFGVNYVADNSKMQTVSTADEIKKYKDLLDNGIITQEEFDAKKKQLLGL